ncbi:MAG: hypothetical protein U5R06_20640 [candidate division KSB1 bacterium]|nr:hypothetical protein [candidate division KSB1 bacterium]
MRKYLYCIVTVLTLSFACGEQASPVRELKHYPVDNLDNLLTSENVELDTSVTADGNGALRVTVEDTTVVPLYKAGDIDVENARLVYQAQLRTRDLQGNCYLEMWCVFPEKGRYFSRGLQNPLTGDTDWVQRAILFNLKEGENPDSVEFNLVVNGQGTVWIDDIRVIRRPLGRL